jgi:hypothetical protein
MIEQRDSRGGIQVHLGSRGGRAGRTGMVDKRSLVGAVCRPGDRQGSGQCRETPGTDWLPAGMLIGIAQGTHWWLHPSGSGNR